MGYWDVDASGACSECGQPQAISAMGARRPTCGSPACLNQRRLKQGNAARRLKAGLGGVEGNCRVCGDDIPFRPGKGSRPVTCWREGNTCAKEWIRRETKRFHDLDRSHRVKLACVICGYPVARHKRLLCANIECQRLYKVGNHLAWRHGRRIVDKFCKICGTGLPLGQISLCGEALCDERNNRLHGEARRAGKWGGAGTHTWVQWSAVLRGFDGHCAYCARDASLGKDHVLPLSRGGTNLISNLLPVCKSCNSQKRHRTLWEWSAVLAKKGMAGTRTTWWADDDARFAHVIIEAPSIPLVYSRTAAAASRLSGRG